MGLSVHTAQASTKASCDTRRYSYVATSPSQYTSTAAKFSTPFNIAVAFVTGAAGFEAFSERTVRDERVLALTAKVRYIIDPINPYPKQYTGHVRMNLKDGRVFEERQPHIRGGMHEPLTRADLKEKFAGNARYGGWEDAQAARFLRFAAAAFYQPAFDQPIDLGAFRA